MHWRSQRARRGATGIAPGERRAKDSAEAASCHVCLESSAARSLLQHAGLLSIRFAFLRPPCPAQFRFCGLARAPGVLLCPTRATFQLSSPTLSSSILPSPLLGALMSSSGVCPTAVPSCRAFRQPSRPAAVLQGFQTAVWPSVWAHRRSPLVGGRPGKLLPHRPRLSYFLAPLAVQSRGACAKGAPPPHRRAVRGARGVDSRSA